MENRVKIICTIGPSSNKPEVLNRLRDRGVNFFRINLSHTNEEDIEQRIKDLIGYNIPVILDTEGAQVRSGNTADIFIEEGSIIKVHSSKINCNYENIFLNPRMDDFFNFFLAFGDCDIQELCRCKKPVYVLS